MPPSGVAALSLLIAILNNDLRLHSIGRMQVGLFWVGIVIQFLSSEDPAPLAVDVPLLPRRDSVDCAFGGGSGRAVQPQLSWAEVEIQESLGNGSYATVYAAKWSGTRVALKCWIDDGGSDERVEAKVLAEAALLMELRHPNILSVYGVLPRPRALVMECGVCTLGQVLCGEEARTTGLRWARRVDLARDVAAGVEFLHSHAPPIIHGDITCSNCLVATDGRCKVRAALASCTELCLALRFLHTLVLPAAVRFRHLLRQRAGAVRPALGVQRGLRRAGGAAPAAGAAAAGG